MRRLLSPLFPISLALLFCLSCDDEQETPTHDVQAPTLGVMLEPTPQNLALEYAAFKKQRPDLDENEAKKQFDRIQFLSQKQYDKTIAQWADRKALANAWLKTQLEDVYSPETVGDDMLNAAIDAYAFKSGHPALMTVSHLLVKPDKFSTPQERIEILTQIRQEMIQNDDFSDDAFRLYAEKLLHAGFRADTNADLTFPETEMISFMGEQLSYSNVVEPFAKAAFALSETNRLSPVVETQFGHHLILFQKLEPEKKASLPEDRQFLIESIVLHGRKLAISQMLKNLMNDATIFINEEKVNAIVGLQKSPESQTP